MCIYEVKGYICDRIYVLKKLVVSESYASITTSKSILFYLNGEFFPFKLVHIIKIIIFLQIQLSICNDTSGSCCLNKTEKKMKTKN